MQRRLRVLGIPNGDLRSSFQHCGDLIRDADQLGYQAILLPSGWIAGQDGLTFAAAMAFRIQQVNQLVALRMGEVRPPMLARAISIIDHIAQGRMCVNIISTSGHAGDGELRTGRDRSAVCRFAGGGNGALQKRFFFADQGEAFSSPPKQTAGAIQVDRIFGSCVRTGTLWRIRV